MKRLCAKRFSSFNICHFHPFFPRICLCCTAAKCLDCVRVFSMRLKVLSNSFHCEALRTHLRYVRISHVQTSMFFFCHVFSLGNFRITSFWWCSPPQKHVSVLKLCLHKIIRIIFVPYRSNHKTRHILSTGLDETTIYYVEKTKSRKTGLMCVCKFAFIWHFRALGNISQMQWNTVCTKNVDQFQHR